MKKYIATMVNSMKKSLVYRANSFIMVFSVFFSFVVLFYFWSSIYLQGNSVGNYSLQQIISYYVFITIFELLVVGDNTAWSVGEEIKSGQITGSILKPIGYLEYKLSQSIGGLCFRLLLFSPAIILALFLLKDYLVISSDTTAYGIFAITAALSYLLYFLIYFIVGIISFWAVDSYGLFFTAFVVINFMQGGLLPLDLLPKWFSILSAYLPFQYLFFVPVGMVTSRAEFHYTAILIPLMWCIVLYLFARFLFTKGIKKYEGYGI